MIDYSSEKKAINLIFTKDFDLSTIDPSLITLPFIVSAILHDYNYYPQLRKYIQDDDYSTIIQVLFRHSRLDRFLNTVMIYEEFENYLIFLVRKLDPFSNLKEYPVKKISYSYSEGLLLLEDRVSDRQLQIDEYSFINALAHNSQLPHVLVKECEKKILEYVSLHSWHIFREAGFNGSSSLNDEEKEAILQYPLDNIKKHPNYSLGKFILKGLNAHQED